jgi:ABC-2 type transport system permease protein
MNKILLIIKREYLSRVRKKSFIIMTILGPVLMAGLILAPILLMDSSDEEKKEIWVCDENNLFEPQFDDLDGTDYQFFKNDLIEVKERFNSSDGYALVHIPKFDNQNIDMLESSVKVYVHKPMSLSNQNQISNNIESVIESIKLKEEGLTRDIIDRTRSNVNLNTIILGESGSEKTGSTEVSMGISMFGGFLIYIFIFLYGAMVMRGVMEEKTSRIVEIIISSVKPTQLMMGKIIGIALVGFTQFALWVSLTFVISSVATTLLVNPADINPADMANGSEMLIQEVEMNQGGFASVFEQLESINITFLLVMFLFYFIGGYLMYGSLFAAVGSAVDSETDSQQFMLPITIPLIFSFIALQTILENPDSSLAFWCSIIPFTSPIVMMGRLPFDPPFWEIVLSMLLLIVGFIFTSWLAGRIYRVGILMYGQKVNYKTLWKWIKQS